MVLVETTALQAGVDLLRLTVWNSGTLVIGLAELVKSSHTLQCTHTSCHALLLCSRKPSCVLFALGVHCPKAPTLFHAPFFFSRLGLGFTSYCQDLILLSTCMYPLLCTYSVSAQAWCLKFVECSNNKIISCSLSCWDKRRAVMDDNKQIKDRIIVWPR